jgi:hypothetical protein
MGRGHGKRREHSDERTALLRRAEMKLPPEQRCASIPIMKIRHGVAALLLLSCAAFAQQKPQPQRKEQNQTGAAERLGMTCAQILAMNSSDWIAKVVAKQGSGGDGELRGIRVYGQCYDGRTDQLATALARKGAGPKKSALENLKDFQAGIEQFKAKTLADMVPPADSAKTAYAGLYEKQFRYEFYQGYEQKTLKGAAPPKALKPSAPNDSQPQQPKGEPPPTTSPGARSADLPSAPKMAPLTGVPGADTAKTPAATSAQAPAAAAPNKAAEPEATPKEIDPFTKAKNHFGELLGLLPEDNMHEVHSAFGRLFSGNPVSEDLREEVYEYAIFLLERPSDPPFAPPPF